MRIDTTIKTSQSFWKAANHVFEAENLLTTKETMPWRWTWIWWVGVSTTASAGLSALRRYCVSLILWCCNVTKKTHPPSSCCCPDTLKSPRMEIIHGLLDLVFIFRVFSSLLLASTLVSWGVWGHTRCADWDQPNWNSDTAWMANRDVGQLPAQIG